MVELSRTVRFTLSDGAPTGGRCEPGASPRANTYAAWPAMRGLGRYYELEVLCRGEADPDTGYFINIREIDEAVWEHVLPYLESFIADPMSDAADAPLGEILRSITNTLSERLNDKVAAVTLNLTPTYSLTLQEADMSHVTVRQQFDFAAAHRLHADALSDEENKQTFGKCNNPAGHGHNYRVEVAVQTTIDPQGHAFDVEELDEAVKAAAIDHLDHKNLNEDVPAFAELNPTVEHIAQVIWGMLAPKVADLGHLDDATLVEVSVWETEKTRCTYRGA
ncbi:MAG: 6-carboxytetrahydropterin synthase [Planctomycetota bacterium]